MLTVKNLNNTESEEKVYVKAVWIAYYELQSFTKGNDEKTFKKLIQKEGMIINVQYE